ncbi:ilvE [Symbiodinium microadriaticum]|nr:ilvE [Symbiodinium microadriaticum]
MMFPWHGARTFGAVIPWSDVKLTQHEQSSQQVLGAAPILRKREESMWERLETEFEKGLPRHEEIQELQQRSRGMLRIVAAGGRASQAPEETQSEVKLLRAELQDQMARQKHELAACRKSIHELSIQRTKSEASISVAQEAASENRLAEKSCQLRWQSEHRMWSEERRRLKAANQRNLQEEVDRFEQCRQRMSQEMMSSRRKLEGEAREARQRQRAAEGKLKRMEEAEEVHLSHAGEVAEARFLQETAAQEAQRLREQLGQAEAEVLAQQMDFRRQVDASARLQDSFRLELVAAASAREAMVRDWHSQKRHLLQAIAADRKAEEEIAEEQAGLAEQAALVAAERALEVQRLQGLCEDGQHDVQKLREATFRLLQELRELREDHKGVNRANIHICSLPAGSEELRAQLSCQVQRFQTRFFLDRVVRARDDVRNAYNTPVFRKTKRNDLAEKWDNLGFSIRPLNGHVRYTWSDGSWDSGVFVPAPYQLMHINAGALHYGVSCFEGMKAFSCKDGKIRLLNPELNAKRMQKGAGALLMPEVPTDMFVTAVMEAVQRNKEFVPPYGNNASMYVRPLLFASGQMLGLAPLASEYTFFVTVLPAGGYFGKGSEVGVKALVSTNHDRAAPKGLGAVKAAGNYAADLSPVHGAHAQGYNTTLYLDAKQGKYVEEFSVCNFVGITKDGHYITPKSDTILQSTTNIMLQQLARDRGMIVEERPIDFQAEISNFKEIGMCGTAAVVVKVNSIRHEDTVYDFDEFDTMASLRSELTSIQCGELEDKHGWMKEICDAVDTSFSEEYSPPAVSLAPGMVTAEAKGTVQKMGSEAMHGLERSLLEHVVSTAQPGNPDSVIAAMDAFWNKTFQAQGAQKWNVRGQKIEEKVQESVQLKAGSSHPVRCLEMGTYCGYSALRIARNLPDGGKLLSVEKDELFAAIATKIIEFAGLDSKVKIWMGTVHSELVNITDRMERQPADFVLVDHSKERYVPDLKLLEDCGVIDKSTTVVGDVEVYPGDERLPKAIQQEISEYFSDREFALASMACLLQVEDSCRDDPRFISLTNQDTRCKYQYYRAQCACPESQLEDPLKSPESRSPCPGIELGNSVRFGGWSWEEASIMYGKDNYAMQQGYPYGAYADELGPSKPLMGPPQTMTRQRINLIGIIMALFVPWFVFIAMCGLWCFKLRYTSPGVVIVITLALGILLGLYTLHRVMLSCRAIMFGQYHLVETGRFAVWLLFIAVTASIAFVLGMLIGSYNYQTNMRSIFDVVSLNSYVEVNPATMRGQELMDAGKVQFVAGAGLDFHLANGFKNTDIFCVAPITVNNMVLASYDFWAVGKNCCSDQQADFKCGAYNSDGPKGGLRITSDEDRDFYRLAVQQAESAYAIKAIHPLFFEWTADSSKQVLDDERAGYQVFLMSIIAHFLFQAFLVLISVACFTKYRFE